MAAACSALANKSSAAFESPFCNAASAARTSALALGCSAAVTTVAMACSRWALIFSFNAAFSFSSEAVRCCSLSSALATSSLSSSLRSIRLMRGSFLLMITVAPSSALIAIPPSPAAAFGPGCCAVAGFAGCVAVTGGFLGFFLAPAALADAHSVMLNAIAASAASSGAQTENPARRG